MDHLSTNAQWCIIRQRAGPFVKAFSTDNRRFLRQCLGRSHAAPAMSGTSVDRLELRLALFGYDGVFYSLTFSNENLPRDFSGVQRIWSCFLKRLKRWRKGKPLDFYVYRIEGLHGDHRWHIHAFLRDQDFPPAVVRYLWTWGFVDDEPYTFKRVLSEKGFRQLAIYFTKERPEVGRHAWGASRSLSAFIPRPEIRPSRTGRISIPRSAILLPCDRTPQVGQWGAYQYDRYLLPENSTLYLNSRI